MCVQQALLMGCDRIIGPVAEMTVSSPACMLVSRFCVPDDTSCHVFGASRVLTPRPLNYHLKSFIRKMSTQVEKNEDLDFQAGPLSVLTHSVKTSAQVLISCRNNRKLLGRVKAFDRHCNMVLENVKELWTEVPKTGKGVKKARTVSKDRFLSKMFIRGDSVILVLRNPK